MKGQQAIVERILSDARQEAAQITGEAEDKVREMKARQQAQADSMIAAFSGTIEARAQEIRHRRISVGKLDMRKKMLAAKQALIDEAFAAALAKVKAMSDGEYRALITRLVEGSVSQDGEEIVFGALDPHHLGGEFVKELNQRLAPRGIALTLGAPSPDFDCGFILRRGGRETNCTMAAVLKTMRERIEPEVASLLFEEK